MENLIIAIDQSTSATKAMLFNEKCEMLHRVNVPHKQYYPRGGWVEHDAEEIYENVLKAVTGLLEATSCKDFMGQAYRASCVPCCRLARHAWFGFL